jgi:tRNA 2-thiouridine synthesizing protein A
MDDGLDEDERTSARGRELSSWLDAHDGAPCASCARALCAHELLFASALGHRREPLCSACAASRIGARDVDALRAHLRSHFERRGCYRAAWRHAGERDERCALARLLPADVPPDERVDALEIAHETWDAGDLGCGELVLELRLRLGSLRAGEVLELFARDPGAPEDLPAWCRLTGHALVGAQPPRYLIRRRQG